MRPPTATVLRCLFAWSVLLPLTSLFTASAATNVSTWIFPGDGGRLMHRADYQGNRIPDMSGVGYKGGTVPLPHSNAVPVKITVSPVPGDNVANIQNAINFVQSLPPDTNGFRGAVLLLAGEYPLNNTINIRSNGVVLRGVGSGLDGTVLRATRTNQYTLVRIFGAGSASTVANTTKTITNLYVPVGARSFHVDNTSGLSVGDRVFVRRIATTNWITDMGMDQLCCEPDVSIWTPSGYHIDMDRVITRIEGNRIFIDAPVTCAIDARYTNGTLRRYSWSGRIQNSGIEHVRGVSDFNAGVTNDENHGWIFVQFTAIENGWARNLVSQYFGYACISLSGGAKSVTITDCQALDPVSQITGGRRYAFVLDDSTMCLVKNCYNRQDRHQYVTQSLTTGPNVFLDSASDNARSDAGPHHRWSTAAFWDNITVNGHNLNIQNRGNSGSGHGWAGGNCIVWNSKANAYVVQNPPGAHNWLIGSVGTIQNGSGWVGPHDPGTYDSHGTNVFPNSLYYAQLQERLAASGLGVREYWLGQIDSFTNSPEAVSVDAAWSTAIEGVAAGKPLSGFDVITNNHLVPFTFNFTVDPGDRIVGATLIVALRSTNSAAGNTLYLDQTTNALSFTSLGWLPISTSTAATNISVRLLDLTAQTNLLADGRLNLALQGDIGIDWAMLELRVAPPVNAGTFSLLPVADATVRGGTSANLNFGATTNLAAAEDASANNDRKAYLRWDLSGVTGIIYHARIRLMPINVGTNGIEQGLALANSNGWAEAGLTWNNQPNAAKRFATWIPGANAPVEIAVTPQVLEALQGDKQLSVQLYSLRDVGAAGFVEYASREHPDAAFRPQLVLLASALPPVISDITNRTVAVNGATGPIEFTVGSASVPADDLQVSGASSNTNLVPNANIVFGGSGANRTVTITPATNQSGVAVITVTVTDTAGLFASDNFSLSVLSHAPGVFVWNGPGAGSHNWTTGSNWSPPGPPEALDDLKFFDPGAAGVAVSNVNNVIDAAFGGTIASLQYGNTNGNHTTLIAANQTLNVSGIGGLLVGTGQENGAAHQVNATITGPQGALVIDHPAANFNVRQGSATNGGHRATLNLSGLGTLDVNVARLLLGGDGSGTPANNRPAGTLLLARTNLIVASGAAPAINLGDGPSNGGNGVLQLGITNALFADSITVGRQKSSGSILFNPAFASLDPVLFLRGQSGGRVAQFAISDNSAQGTSGSPASGTVDFSDGTVDALIDTLTIGKGQTSSGTGSSTGTLTVESGMLDVNVIEAGYQNAANAAAVAAGTITVNGTASLLINNSLRLARFTGTGTLPVGTLNINGGTVVAQPGIIAGGGTSSVNVNGGTLQLGPGSSAGSPDAPLTSLTLTGSTLRLHPSATVSNVVAAGLTTGGASNVIDLLSLPNSTSGQFTLIRHSGAIGGAGFNFVLGTIPETPVCSLYLSNNLANGSLDLVVENCLVPDPFLAWTGNVDGNWDASTPNWRNNINPELIYSDGEAVVFNDTAPGATNINLTDILAPASVVVSNSLKTFTFVDEGKLSGGMTLTKQGSGTLVIANSDVNDFTGGVIISGGTLQVGNGGVNGALPPGAVMNDAMLVINRSDELIVPAVISGSGTILQRGSGVTGLNGANSFTGILLITNGVLRAGHTSALGTAAGSTVITNSGTLDVNGLNLTAEPIVVADAGSGGGGAIINSGPQQISALRTVTLSGDAVFGGTNRWDIRNSGGTASLNTLPPGSGFSITKVGSNQVSLVGVTAIDSALGDIDIQQGSFGIQTTTTQVGNPNATITVFGSGTLNLFRLTNTPLNKLVMLKDGGTLFSENDRNVIRGAVTLESGNAIFNVNNSGGAAPALVLSNTVSGVGGLTKIGAAPLILTVTNTYAGQTRVDFGTLALVGNGSVPNSAAIAIAIGAMVDASARSDATLHLNNGQLLTGDGTVSGNLMAYPGSILAMGSNGIGSFTVSGSATLGGITSVEVNKSAGMRDLLQVNAMLTYGGTLAVTNLAGILAANDSFKIFNASVYAGAFTNLVPATPAPGLMWDLSQLTVNGTLRIAVAPSPAIVTVNRNGANLLITGTNGPANGSYRVITSTNLAHPLLDWVTIKTNQFDGDGAFSVSVAVDPAVRASFYQLQLE